ncbi:Uncharacterised protein [uncultured archaeon]|nr:Uncharacterised protein [uncultured archaeon]
MESLFGLRNRYKMTAALFVAGLALFALGINADAEGQRLLTVAHIIIGALLIPLSMVRTDFDVNRAGREELMRGFTTVFLFAVGIFAVVFLNDIYLRHQALEFTLFDAAVLVILLSRVFVLKVMGESMEQQYSEIDRAELDAERRRRSSL